MLWPNLSVLSALLCRTEKKGYLCLGLDSSEHPEVKLKRKTHGHIKSSRNVYDL